MNLIYSWTPREYRNFIQGAKLAEIDEHERAIQVAWVAGIVSKPKKGRKEPAPKKYFDAEKGRNEILSGQKAEKQKLDFTLYDKMREEMRSFDWKKAYVAQP